MHQSREIKRALETGSPSRFFFSLSFSSHRLSPIERQKGGKESLHSAHAGAIVRPGRKNRFSLYAGVSSAEDRMLLLLLFFIPTYEIPSQGPRIAHSRDYHHRLRRAKGTRAHRWLLCVANRAPPFSLAGEGGRRVHVFAIQRWEQLLSRGILFDRRKTLRHFFFFFFFYYCMAEGFARGLSGRVSSRGRFWVSQVDGQ